MEIEQYCIYLTCLDPTIGCEIKKTSPCIVISPNEMNFNIGTVILAPLTTKSHAYPTRVPIKHDDKKGWIVLDQIRTVDKKRLIKNLGSADKKTITKIKAVLQEMLID